MSHLAYSYGKQIIESEDIQAVLETMQSSWLTQGPQASRFEDALCTRFGARHSTVLSSGTAALHLIGLALGWKPGDLVLTVPLTFLATANSVLYAGARVDFVDIDGQTGTIDVNQLEARIKEEKQRGSGVKAVIAVDYAGNPCDWTSLRMLADKYEFQLVDDACHALGALHKGKEICSSVFADAVSLSFHPVKHITTGEGGAILTNNPDLDKRVKTLRTHGMTKDEGLLSENHGPWYYEMHDVGFNYRITDFQCALGVAQLSRLDKFLASRREIAAYYDRAFEKYDFLDTLRTTTDGVHAYHLYPILLRQDRMKVSKKDFFLRLQARNIFTQVHYIPVHLQPYYRKKFGFKPGDFPAAENFYHRELSIPMYPSLVATDLNYITRCLIEELEVAT